MSGEVRGLFTRRQHRRRAGGSTLGEMDACVPVVSLAAGGRRAAADHPAGLSRTAASLDRAFRDVGFAAVVDHGIDHGAVAAALAACREFFALDAERKRRYVARCAPGVHRGYGGLGAEAQAAAVGEVTLPDRSETFSIGPLRDPSVHDEFAVPDVWPDADVPAMRAALVPFRASMDALARRLLEACSLALFDDPFATAAWVEQPLGALRANHYPQLDRPLEAGEWRAGAHTDYTLLTVLTTDDVAGLEIEVDGCWRPVTAPPGAFVVNVGDLLAVASGGRWRSTWHRVGTPAGPPPHPARTSIAFFHSAAAHARIEGLTTPDGAECTAGEYLRAKVRLLFGTPADP